MRTSSRSAFTLIELLIGAMIVAILATLVVTNTTRTRAKARDASRRTTVEAYSTSLEQWRAISPTKSYFVQMPTGGCTATGVSDPADPAYGYMVGSGAGCVGYRLGGAGRMTRRDIAGKYPANNSIADALRAAGVLNTIKVDPRLEGLAFDVDDPWADFILTTCNTAGYAATSPVEALNYTIYTNLELLEDVLEEESAKQQCGGENSPGPWATVQ